MASIILVLNRDVDAARLAGCDSVAGGERRLLVVNDAEFMADAPEVGDDAPDDQNLSVVDSECPGGRSWMFSVGKENEGRASTAARARTKNACFVFARRAGSLTSIRCQGLLEAWMQKTKNDARKAVRGGIRIVREVGRVAGQAATMILSATALGGVIAGVSIALFSALEPGGGGARTFADLHQSEGGDQFVEVRSVSVRRARQAPLLERASECASSVTSPRRD